MAHAIVISEKVIEAVNALQDRLYAKHWGEHSRASFVYSVIHTVHALEEINELLLEAKSQLEKEGRNVSGLQEHLRELQSITVLLDRNQKLEQARVQKAKDRGIAMLADDIVNPELYSSLEQRVLGFVLKTRFLVERLSIMERKEQGEQAIVTRSTKKVLDLLDEKEKELQELRKKHDELRKHSYLARIEEHSSIDIETEINELAKKMEGEQRVLETSLESFRRTTEQLQHAYSLMREKFRTTEEISSKLSTKTTELASVLKKERDYAKRIVLDIENETLRLRNAYSSQILSIEEGKALNRKEAEEKTSQKVSGLQKELHEQQELAKQLKESLLEKEKEIQKLHANKRKNAQ